MNPRVKEVKTNPNYTLTLIFTNGEVKIFDVTPYLDKGIFKELKEMSLFRAVRPFLGSIQWPSGQDFCPDVLYLDSKNVEEMSEEKLPSEQTAQHSKIGDR